MVKEFCDIFVDKELNTLFVICALMRRVTTLKFYVESQQSETSCLVFVFRIIAMRRVCMCV